MKIRITKELAEKIKREVIYLAVNHEDVEDIIEVVLENNFDILEDQNEYTQTTTR